MDIRYDILDEQRRTLLPSLEFLRTHGFYLAGGTALALQLGHRDSVDFDFFRIEPIEDTSALFDVFTKALAPHACVKTQEERNTLGALVDGTVRLSMMTFPYQLAGELVRTSHLDLASVEDIGCMKLNAITGRGAWKDYVDLYFITNVIELGKLMGYVKTMMPQLDPLLALKSLVYFEDLHDEAILYKVSPIAAETIRETLISRVREYSGYSGKSAV